MITIEAMKVLETGALYNVRISADAETAALLPKSVRLNAQGCGYIEFQANGANGGINETGIKRMKSLLRAVDKLGLGIVFDQPANVRDELNAKLWGMPGSLLNIARGELESLMN